MPEAIADIREFIGEESDPDSGMSTWAWRIGHAVDCLRFERDRIPHTYVLGLDSAPWEVLAGPQVPRSVLRAVTFSADDSVEELRPGNFVHVDEAEEDAWQALDAMVIECNPWLNQGDIFEEIPILIPEAKGNVIDVSVPAGPAILVTHDCELDKRNAKQRPKIRNMQFLPLLLVATLDANRQGLLRREELTPYEAIYVSEVLPIGECFALLSDMYSLPGLYFGLEIQSYEGQPGADQDDPFHLVATLHATRLGRLDPQRLAMLRAKVQAFWTREVFQEYLA